ncbi:hypothetical protein ALP71_01014 [Pseudomonas coronafaciens pv. garcae]|nr:hypothetical protein ALP71_01014 [Pseudomonas coronafaciens pv. garcae]
MLETASGFLSLKFLESGAVDRVYFHAAKAITGRIANCSRTLRGSAGFYQSVSLK